MPLVNLLGAASAFLAAAIWGGLYVVSKYVLYFVPPLTLVVLRFAIGLATLGAILLLTRGRPVARRDLPALALLGLVGFTVSIGAQFAGTKLSTAANGALITSATPALVVVFARWLLGEKATRPRLFGLALATLGVLVVSDPSAISLAPDLALGNAFLVLAAITWALYSVLAKKASRRYSVLTVTTYATLFGLCFTAPLAAGELAVVGPPPPPTPLVLLGVLYIGVISTAGAFYLWNLGMALLDSAVAGIFFFAQPVVGGFLGWLLLGEQLGAAFFAGGALIFLGVAVVTVWRPPNGAPTRRAPDERAGGTV
ncbi:MAG: DMT family transporter [Chloroflexi bacterium]|nr:DMT family transporter [Chloroflexota bacterium]